MRAWRMGNHQIPAQIKDVLNWRHEMGTCNLSWQQVATPRIVPMSAKGITHSAAVLTGNENPHYPC